MNTLNFDKKFTIPKFNEIAKAIIQEESIRDSRIRITPGSRYVITNPLLNNLILKLCKLTGYDESKIALKYTNQSKLLNAISIIERIFKLSNLFFQNISNNNNYNNYNEVYNFFGILAFININNPQILNYQTLNNYIKKINGYSKNILVLFLYNIIQYRDKLNQSNNKTKYNTFIDNYKKLLFDINKSFFSPEKLSKLFQEGTNFKRIINANIKAELNIIAAQNKARANAIAAQNKAKANAIAAQNKAKANAKLIENKKCINQWEIYNKYKLENPRLFKLGIGRPNRPPATCESLRAPKQPVSLNKNKNNNSTNNSTNTASIRSNNSQ
jgi:hypothetical protein